MSATSTRRLSATAKPAAMTVRLAPIAARTARKRQPALERGDLLAVPLCILWGIGLWMWPFGIPGLAGGSGAGNPLSLLWEVPLTLARHVIGW